MGLKGRQNVKGGGEAINLMELLCVLCWLLLFYLSPWSTYHNGDTVSQWIFEIIMGLPRGLSGKESTCNAGDMGLIPASGRSLGEEMATHSSILAWEIPWTEKPGEPQSLGLQRVGHN